MSEHHSSSCSVPRRTRSCKADFFDVLGSGSDLAFAAGTQTPVGEPCWECLKVTSLREEC